MMPATLPQSTAVLALGNMSPACHALVLKEASVLADDFADKQIQRVRWTGVLALVWVGRAAVAGRRAKRRLMCLRAMPSDLFAQPNKPTHRQSIAMPSVPGMMGRRAARKDDVRLAAAHLTRMLAHNLPPGSLPDNVVGGVGWCRRWRQWDANLV